MANTETNQDKLKALQLTLDKIEKNFGKGSVMKLGDNVVEDVAVIPSGSIGLDRALGVGGYPKGRVIEIFGPESSGKTTLAIHRRGTKTRRYRGYHRCRTRFRSVIRRETGS